MTAQGIQGIVGYTMHPRIETAYRCVHDWFDANSNMTEYRSWTYEHDAKRALSRETPVAAAFNFHCFFATHYFKTCHALQSDSIIGFAKLAAWLRHNPYITIIDIGCGDGAGSVAVIDTIFRLREERQLDPRSIQVYCIGIDPNPNGLSVYEKMMEEVTKSASELDINVSYDVCPHRISEAFSCAEQLLFDIRRRRKQPVLSHSIVIEANLNDFLEQEDREEKERLEKYGALRTYSPEPFGRQLASFYHQLFEGVPIDHLHILSIDTEPDKIQKTVKEMLSHVKDRFDERGHVSEYSDIHLERIGIKNPMRSFWRKKETWWPINSFVVSTCHIHNRELKLDARWQKITSRENLELAWARARQEMLREAFSDEVEIRLFELELESNLKRLHFELDAYAIRAGYIPQTLSYATPKDLDKDRPRGLTWLEEEILMIAIIQVIGANALQKPWSYAYRLSPENSLERGATEYLYERWTDAWESFRQDIGKYAEDYQHGIVVKTDIKSYYTRILQDRLRELVKDEMNISKRIEWLIELLVSKDLIGHDPGRGLVQGSIGSGFLANVYLTPLDTLFPVNDLKGRRLFRYVDDIVVVVPDAADEQITKDHLLSTIAELHLEHNPAKTDTYSIEQFLLSFINPDEKLDRLRKRYEELADPLWWMNEDLRVEFRESAGKARTWWSDVLRYRSCLVELGFYITEAWLSRELSRTICIDKGLITQLDFPALPYVASISEAYQWADEFRNLNLEWDHDVKALKRDFSNLFMENLAVIINSSEDGYEHEVDTASRRLRFAANRLGLLGLDSIHSELTGLLCEKPWFVRDQHRLIADLARQGYSGDIWHLVDAHQNRPREMSVYMRAVALRAVRFLPRLEIDEWQKLVDFLYIGEEITKLMATETWLVITSNMRSIPLADKVQERVKSILNASDLPTRRLLKNYLLVLGRINPTEVTKLNMNFNADPLISSAYDIGLKGSVPNLFGDIEPEILRQKYYSTTYRYYDDGSRGSIY
jgi:hypothetical protein